MTKRILWIEDDAFHELGMLATPVHLTGEYDLDYALSATEAIGKLCGGDYDAVVVDVRLPPGNDRRWVDMYYQAGANNKQARLGVRLLQNILGKDKQWTGGLREAARDWRRYGVLSMEAWEDIRRDLATTKITLYRNKKDTEGSRVLLRIIEAILQQQNGGDHE